MPVDALGNDLASVPIPIDGFLAYGPDTLAFPTPAEGADPAFVLPAGWVKAGLITEDGGFEWSLEADGDPIVFFQQGYSIPSGLANAECTVKLAQYDEIVRELAWGEAPDENGYITIDAGGHPKVFKFFTAEVMSNGTIRRRVAQGTVKTVAVDKSERGSVNGTEVVFSAQRHPSLRNRHLGEWLIPDDALAPTP